MITKIVKNILDYFGVRVSRKIHSNYRIVQETPSCNITHGIVDEIFEFFDLIPPFYDSSVRDELKIAGAWGEDLKVRRKNQLELLKARNFEGYIKLLDNLLVNELVSGQWSIRYFEKSLLNKGAPEQFLANLQVYENLTGDTDYSSLIDGDYGGRWGVKIGSKTLLLPDPYKGINAFNVANYLNSLNLKQNVYMDFGSGIGSDTIKVSKMVKRPTRFLLCDIPLNLTTAYAYVSANVNFKCHLVSSLEQLNKVLKSTYTAHEFIFVPSIFIEEMAKQISSIDLMYNHGSFSEMDYNTIKFYMDVLLTRGPVKALLEINSNTRALNTSSHIEVPSSEFPLPKCFKLIYKLPSVNTEFRHRYVQSLYVRTS